MLTKLPQYTYVPAVPGQEYQPERTVCPPPVYPPADCYVIPEVPYVEASPARVDTTPVFAWDAGANSDAQHDGDVFVRITQPKSVGVVIGFTTDRNNVESYSRLSHAIYYHQSLAGQALLQLVEYGVLVTQPMPHDPQDVWEIRRVGGLVSYWCNGEAVYLSANASSGELSVGTALYATGDTAPGQAPA